MSNLNSIRMVSREKQKVVRLQERVRTPGTSNNRKARRTAEANRPKGELVIRHKGSEMRTEHLTGIATMRVIELAYPATTENHKRFNGHLTPKADFHNHHARFCNDRIDTDVGTCRLYHGAKGETHTLVGPAADVEKFIQDAELHPVCRETRRINGEAGDSVASLDPDTIFWGTGTCEHVPKCKG